MSSSKNVDMVNVPIFKGIILYSVPLILSGVLQILYNAADLVVVGRFAGANALASVGATSSLILLIINFFLNFSVGISVVTAREIGATNFEKVSNSVHTSYFMAIIFGVFLTVAGNVVSLPMLKLLKTPAEIITGSETYMKIYFLGAPASLIYNFGAAILNASGDSKRPLVYLSISGIANVILNLVLVIVFKLSTAGVAIATITSQYISAFLVTNRLLKQNDYLKLTIKKIKFYKREFINILMIGIPVGIQGIAFSISNVTIQSSINYFGAQVVAGNSASGSIEGFTYTAMNAIARAALNFSAQNIGAKRYDRLLKIFGICSLLEFVVGFTLGFATYIFGNTLLGFYVTDAGSISYGLIRLLYISVPYFLCGIMETSANMCRSMGKTVLPTVATLIGVCVFRIVWINTVFNALKTPESIYVSYPISWFFTTVFHIILFILVYKKLIANEKNA